MHPEKNLTQENRACIYPSNVGSGLWDKFDGFLNRDKFA
jgi:hypothetical protein